MEDLIGWIVWIIVFILAIVAIFAAIDIICGDFHLYNYLDFSTTTEYRTDGRYKVSDQKEEFKGSYVLNNDISCEAVFALFNSGKQPYNFKNASFYLLDDEWKKYKLEVLEVQSAYYGDGSFVLNPDSYIEISCDVPISFLYRNARILGFQLVGGRSVVRFGYLPRPFWKRFYEETAKPFIDSLEK